MHFESKRLTYEPITQKHAQEMESVLCDSRVYVHVDDGTPPTLEQLMESFRLSEIGPSEHQSHETWIDYIVRTKGPQVAIGRLEAVVTEHRAEVAYMLGADHWGQGYGSELLECLQQFLQKNFGVKEFWATVTPGNESSKHLLLKSGYVEFLDPHLPPLKSYEQNDWVFFRTTEDGCGDANKGL